MSEVASEQPQVEEIEVKSTTEPTSVSQTSESNDPYEHCLKLDELGPMIINSDGTIQRVSNWSELTPEEQQRTYRLITARNKKRIEALKQQQDEEENAQSVEPEPLKAIEDC